ncbi:DinB family protein [Brevibacillus sp. MCWH]|uniref:DinB family protein n=1 Tax=Brevibacillus sp. MCWH TaxID=2508871 RepID=UPI000E36E751|nr:DinB family protein [Brevibacillus sp. MCWH]NNV04395.1 hypothetical protein [Brevibacillus sp. MCWH]REK67364.1 MAG: hypothetical protein DF221_01560 [Brevibacillus sp.]
MFSSISTFLKVWEDEAQMTQRILDACTDDSLQQRVSADDRTLGRIAWHIVCTVHEMMSRTGLQFEAVSEHQPVPSSARDIAEAWRNTSASFVEAIRSQWSDATLQEVREMYGEQWSNGYTLQMLILHMVHHRGQMTVLMRQAGLRVPGTYGPAREEWSNMSMEPPAL